MMCIILKDHITVVVVVVRIRVFLEKKVHSEKINWTRAQTKNSEFPHRDNSSKI